MSSGRGKEKREEEDIAVLAEVDRSRSTAQGKNSGLQPPADPNKESAEEKERRMSRRKKVRVSIFHIY